MHQVARIFAILSTFALAWSTPTLAEPYVLDKSHAHVTFTVDHLGFSTVQGTFRTFDAEIEFSPEKVEESKVLFVIQVDSVDTQWPARDKHLKSKDFFDAKKYPEIVFESKSVTPNGTETAVIVGDLTMVGQTREVQLDARLNLIGPSPFNPAVTIAGFVVTGEIDRSQFGMNFAAPAIGVQIPVRIDLEITPAG
ncbi:MAG: YceI family protein [Pseudomonadota bacterium]